MVTGGRTVTSGKGALSGAGLPMFTAPATIFTAPDTSLGMQYCSSQAFGAPTFKYTVYTGWPLSAPTLSERP